MTTKLDQVIARLRLLPEEQQDELASHIEEELEDIRMYLEAKAANEQPIPFEQAIAEIEDRG